MKAARIALAITALRGAPVRADVPPPAEPDAAEVIVVTGTRVPEPQDSAPVKTDVVTRDEAERRGATNVAEALATQPGVQVNPGAYGYLGGVSAIQIQGFDLDRVLILEDGEPVIGDVGGAIDLASIPMTDIARIEIVTGPTSALYGSSAIGGVVNILTAPPRDEGPSARVREEVRSHGGVVVQGLGAYRAGDTWAALDLAYTRQGGIPADPALPDLQIPGSTRSIAGLRAGARAGAHTEIQLRARWLHQDVAGRESMVYPVIGRFISDLPATTDRYAAHAIATTHFGADRASSLRLSAAAQEATDTSSTFAEGTRLGPTHRGTQVMPSAEATATLADGPRTWVAGARYEAQHLTQRLDDRESNGGVIATTTTQEVTPRWLRSAAAYGQLQWNLGNLLTLLPGVRLEDHGAYGFVAAPRLALAIHPVGVWTVRASAGRGYRTPSAEELGFQFDHSIYGYKVIGNPALTPERSWGVNADVVYRPDSHLALRAGGFANWVDDLIDIDLAAGMTSGTVVTYTYANFERVRTAGAQAHATLRLGEHAEADAAYDYLWTRDDVDHVPLAGEPAHTVTGSLRGRLPGELDGSARARFVGRAYVDATTRSPGYSTVDLRLARALGRGVEADAGVLNLFDVHQTAGAVGDLRPPLGRVLYLGVRAALP